MGGGFGLSHRMGVSSCFGVKFGWFVLEFCTIRVYHVSGRLSFCRRNSFCLSQPLLLAGWRVNRRGGFLCEAG